MSPLRRASICTLIAVVAAACGTLEAEPSAHLVDVGKGPFRDDPAFEVCLAGARVVPGADASTTAGLCVVEAAAGRACDGDGGCSVGERCVCGQCSIEACTPARPCPEGRLCRGGLCAVACQRDDQCASGEICSSGGCTSRCKSDADCGPTASCDRLLKTCSARSCSSSSDCTKGRVCVQQEVAAEVREPAHGPGDALFVELRLGKRRAVHAARFESKARLRITQAPLFDPKLSGGSFAAAPAPHVRSGALVALFVETEQGIVRLVPDDPQGSAFSTPGALVLAPEAPFEEGRVASPAVVDFMGKTRLFYEVGDRRGVALATLGDTGQLEARAPAPIATAESVGDPSYFVQVTEVGSPTAAVRDGLLYVYFTARGIEGGSASQGAEVLPPDANDSVGLLVTEDLSRFDLFSRGPVFARRVNLRTYLGEREPSVLMTDGRASLVYVATDAEGKVAGLAVATNGP